MKKICALMLMLGLLLALAACGAAIPADAILPLGDGEGEKLYFYGSVKSGGVYYAKVLREAADDPTEEDYLYAPLGDALGASFQEAGWVGAWSPVDYDSPAALARAAKKGKITPGARCTYRVSDGCISHLEEVNYYADHDVTGAR